MTTPDNLFSVEELEEAKKTALVNNITRSDFVFADPRLPDAEYRDNLGILLNQLADSMRENERLHGELAKWESLYGGEPHKHSEPPMYVWGPFSTTTLDTDYWPSHQDKQSETEQEINIRMRREVDEIALNPKPPVYLNPTKPTDD